MVERAVRDRRLVEELGVETGVRVVHSGEDLTIHSVKNTSDDRLSSALHVYGGNLIATPKTMWYEPDLTEQPFDLVQVLAS